jgi:hypothetical protein
VPAHDERPVMMNEAMPMEVMAMHEPVPTAEVSMAKVPSAAAMEAAEATAATAMAHLDSKVVGESFRLLRSARADQLRGLHRDAGRSEGHEPRHGEETKQSLHL